MKIAFLCASLEPGRDGVGDYVRRLAAGCTVQGHHCRIFALHDRHVTADTVEPLAGGTIAHRWPVQRPWPARSVALSEELAGFSPDRLSWQFVSYGFDPKGITPTGLATLARDLSRYRSQVMLHETWIGIAQGESPWARFMGWRQSRALLAFLQAVQPAQVQTSNPSYVALLARHGWRASILPLFSNIPVVTAEPQECAALLARHLPAVATDRPRLVGITFGTLHPQWQPEPAARLLHSIAALSWKQPVLVAIGRTGRHGADILARLARAGVPTSTTGELPPAEVSALLQSADLGVASHPWALIGKSGSIAAMRDHGLPILLPRDDWRLRGVPVPALPADPRIARLAELNEDNAAAWLQSRHAPGDSFPASVSQFLKELAA